jgi:hypothetical protein
MRYFSTTDVERMNRREQAALYTEVLKAIGEARRNQRDGEASLQNIRQAQNRKIMRPNL